jgi:anti-sigma factor RsiW
VIAFLDDYSAGELDTARASAFERHLSLCGTCRAYLDGYRRTVEMEKDAYAEPALQAPPEELVQAILSIRRSA